MSLLRKLLLLILITGLAMPAFARKPQEQGYGHRDAPEVRRDKRSRESREAVTLDEAVSRLRKETNSRVLSAEEQEAEYRIRILTEGGTVRRLRIDPGTGEIIRRKR